MNLSVKYRVPRPTAAILLALVLLFLAGCNTATATQVPSTNAVATKAASGKTIAAASIKNAAAIQMISPSNAKLMLANNPKVLLIDVRTADEFAAGHIAGSKLLPYDEIIARTSELPKDPKTPIIVYCRSGRRSAIAAETLSGLGFTEIYDLGGIQDWPYETVTGK
jgi:phage shock protein E